MSHVITFGLKAFISLISVNELLYTFCIEEWKKNFIQSRISLCLKCKIINKIVKKSNVF